jgi:hypothetical protein
MTRTSPETYMGCYNQKSLSCCAALTLMIKIQKKACVVVEQDQAYGALHV